MTARTLAYPKKALRPQPPHRGKEILPFCGILRPEGSAAALRAVMAAYEKSRPCSSAQRGRGGEASVTEISSNAPAFSLPKIQIRKAPFLPQSEQHPIC